MGEPLEESSSNFSIKSNLVTIIVVMGAVVVLLLLGAVYAFKDQIKKGIVPQNIETEVETIPKSKLKPPES